MVTSLPASQSRLPVAEAVQCVVCMVVDHQAVLVNKSYYKQAGETQCCFCGEKLLVKSSCGLQ